jgi:hypothetical protein
MRTPSLLHVSIIEDSPDELIAKIRQAPRAVVFLDVQWSVVAVQGRQCFKEAVKSASTSEFPLISFFVLDEWNTDEDRQAENKTVQQWLGWLGSLGLKELTTVGLGHGIGAGSLIWLEHGKVIHEEWSAAELEAAGILERTRQLWPGQAQAK